MVIFSPLVWYHHLVLLLLPLALLLVHSSRNLRVLGLIIMILIQFERFFNYYVQWFPLPVFVAYVLLFFVYILTFVKMLKSDNSQTRVTT